MRSTSGISRQPRQVQRLLSAVARQLSSGDKVKVGLPQGSNAYPDGTPVALVGHAHEFGIGVPERSFLRGTLHGKTNEYKSIFKKLAKKIIRGQITSDQALNLVGQQSVSFVVSGIGEGIGGELKSRQGTPLHDTGHLIQSITFEVNSDD